MTLTEIFLLVLWYFLGMVAGGLFGGIILTIIVLSILDWFPDLKLYLLGGDITAYLALAILIMVICMMIGAGLGILATYYILQGVESLPAFQTPAPSKYQVSPLQE